MCAWSTHTHTLTCTSHTHTTHARITHAPPIMHTPRTRAHAYILNKGNKQQGQQARRATSNKGNKQQGQQATRAASNKQQTSITMLTHTQFASNKRQSPNRSRVGCIPATSKSPRAPSDTSAPDCTGREFVCLTGARAVTASADAAGFGGARYSSRTTTEHRRPSVRKVSNCATETIKTNRNIRAHTHTRHQHTNLVALHNRNPARHVGRVRFRLRLPIFMT